MATPGAVEIGDAAGPDGATAATTSGVKDLSTLNTLYPHVTPSLQAVTQVVKSLAKTRTPQYCTLKTRLGKKSVDEHGRRRFVSGVEEVVMAALLCRLESSDVWTSVTPWTQSVDRTYLLQTGLQVLTTCETPADASGKPCYVVSHIMQHEVAHVDLQWCNIDPSCMLCRSDGSTCSVRVSLAHDEPVYPDEIQERVDEMTRVDVRQRRCFTYTPKGDTREVWSIDVSLLWRSTTYIDALSSMYRRAPPLYLVELRCVQPLEYLGRLDHSHARLALSLLLKVGDLFDAGTTTPLHLCGAKLVTDRGTVSGKAPAASINKPTTGTDGSASAAEHAQA